MVKLEIASFNITSASIAQQAGADRVELCAQMEVGGTTPCVEDIQKVRSIIDIDLNIMIRPRGGDFVYTPEEFEQMKKEVLVIKEMGVNGLVFGILNVDNTIDKKRNKELVNLAYPLPCTFHRAFDSVLDLEQGLEDVIQCGFQTILTSGCEPNVNLGIANLKKLVDLAQNRIVIMAGGGLRSNNVHAIIKETGLSFVHSSAITDGSDTAVSDEVRAIKDQANL